MNALTSQTSKVTVEEGAELALLQELVRQEKTAVWVYFRPAYSRIRAHYSSQFIGWCLQKCEDEAIFQGAIRMLIEKCKLAEKWLKNLFPEKQPEALTERIMAVVECTTFGQKIAIQFRRIVVKTRAQAAATAIFGVLAFELKQCHTDIYCKKSNYGLPYSLYYDSEKRSYCILCKGDITEADKKGAYKRVTQALEVPLSLRHPVKIVAQSVNLDNRALLDGEFELHKRLFKNDPEGICPLYSVWEYEKKKKVKSSAILEFLPERFDHYLKRASRNEQIDATRQLLKALSRMHEQGYIHGDLDWTNIRCKESVVRLLDFGFTFQMGVNQKVLFGLFPSGFYGRPDRTAPEFLGQREFTGDFRKVEIWALGFVLYSILKGELDFGVEECAKAHRSERPLLMKNCLNKMKEFGPSSGEKDPLMLFIHTLLTFDHQKRPTAHQALELLNKL